jgi:hypothetical protein
VNWLTLDATLLAVPTPHKLAEGASAVAAPFAVPQVPLTGVSVNAPVTVQSAANALVTYGLLVDAAPQLLVLNPANV